MRPMAVGGVECLEIDREAALLVMEVLARMSGPRQGYLRLLLAEWRHGMSCFAQYPLYRHRPIHVAGSKEFSADLL